MPFFLVFEFKELGLTVLLFNYLKYIYLKFVCLHYSKAITAYKYENVYRGVFPVKVCQQRHVIEEIVEYGRKYTYGLEVWYFEEDGVVL